MLGVSPSSRPSLSHSNRGTNFRPHRSAEGRTWEASIRRRFLPLTGCPDRNTAAGAGRCSRKENGGQTELDNRGSVTPCAHLEPLCSPHPSQPIPRAGDTSHLRDAWPARKGRSFRPAHKHQKLHRARPESRTLMRKALAFGYRPEGVSRNEPTNGRPRTKETCTRDSAQRRQRQVSGCTAAGLRATGSMPAAKGFQAWEGRRPQGLTQRCPWRSADKSRPFREQNWTGQLRWPETAPNGQNS